MTHVYGPTSPEQVPGWTQQQLRDRYLVEDLFVPGTVRTVVTHYDRVVAVGAVPTDAPLRLEAVPEILELKTTVLGAIEEHVSSETVIATNTSSIPITRLAATLRHPERFVGLHFFNPVPKMPLVELVPAESTSEETREQVQRFAEDVLGKRTFVVGDRPGFVVNALLIPFLLSAIRMAESGFATPGDIDRAMVLGCAHPTGPLALADLVGLDTVTAIADSMYAEFKEPLYAPPPLLLRMVEAGRLGKKTGRGFYRYDAPRAVARAVR